MSRGAGNRYMIYALFPECRVSMHVIWGIQVAEHRLLDRQVDHRSQLADRHRPPICLGYDGGGHKAAGTCQVDNARVVAELFEKLASSAQ